MTGGRNGTRKTGHILIGFLAYALWKTLQQWASRAGLGDPPCTILTELSRIHAADIMLPRADRATASYGLAAWCDLSPRKHYSFSVQALLLQRLGLNLYL